MSELTQYVSSRKVTNRCTLVTIWYSGTRQQWLFLYHKKAFRAPPTFMHHFGTIQARISAGLLRWRPSGPCDPARELQGMLSRIPSARCSCLPSPPSTGGLVSTRRTGPVRSAPRVAATSKATCCALGWNPELEPPRRVEVTRGSELR